MKKAILILTIGFLGSCTSGVKESNVYSEEENLTEEITEADFKTVVTEIPFSGYYVNEKYLTTLQKTKSPRKAQEAVSESLIMIPNKTLVQTIMIYDFHDGGAYLTVLKHGDEYELWTLYDNETDKFVSKIEILDTNKIKIDNTIFVKYQNVQDEQEYLQIIEQHLFSGRFLDEQGNVVVFDQNGTVKGLESFKYYSIVFDYLDVARDIDLINFGETIAVTDRFGFRFLGDTLYLHETQCVYYDSMENFCGKIDFGELKHKLWRKNN